MHSLDNGPRRNLSTFSQDEPRSPVALHVDRIRNQYQKTTKERINFHDSRFFHPGRT